MTTLSQGSLPKAEDLIRAAAPTTQKSTTQPAKPAITRLQLDNGVLPIYQR